MDIQEKVKHMPDSPGVYLMKNKEGKIIYIGKAKSLKKRLLSYTRLRLVDKTGALIQQVCDIEYRICQSEALALILEASLIHRFKPKYNVSLKDDKSFPFVKVTYEDFPAIYITRKREKDNARYFGPYTNTKLLKMALKAIRKNFPYRSCKKLPSKPCIYYRIKLSPAPCIGKVSQKEYAKTIKRICLILDGSSDKLLKKLSLEMGLNARKLNFEEAAVLRDKILALSSLQPESYALPSGIDELKEVLKLKNIPRRIEAFDVSNIFGSQATASLVSFYNGLSDKSNYRRFRIKTVNGINDYKMLAEALSRRYKRLKEENAAMPDLILVDGGKGQLWAAKKELDSLGLDIPIISLAKKKEEIYTYSKNAPIRLKNNSVALRLIQQIRDESHRFALNYHHILRRNKLLERS